MLISFSPVEESSFFGNKTKYVKSVLNVFKFKDNTKIEIVISTKKLNYTMRMIDPREEKIWSFVYYFGHSGPKRLARAPFLQ